MNREPRRVERMSWDHAVHLGALDSDVDELHRLRLQSESHNEEKIEALDKKATEKIEAIEKKVDSLVGAITKLTLAIIAGLVTLVVDILKGTLFS